MSFFSERLNRIKPTQVLSQGLSLRGLIDSDALSDLESRFPDADLHVSEVTIQVLPKKKSDEGEKQEPVEGEIQTPAQLSIEHPTFQHEQDKVVVVTSTNATVLERIISKPKEK